MDIGIQEIVDQIILSTTNYLVVFMPLFSVIAGLVLAYIVSGWLIEIIRNVVSPRGNGYAPGDYMANMPDMTSDDQDYYRSDEYPGNWPDDDPRFNDRD